MAKVYQTPGVYLEEKNAFPNSAVPVPTAVPAFIGYTEKAVRADKPLLLQPTKISSYGEYLQYFGGRPKTKFTVSAPTEGSERYKLSIAEAYFTFHSQIKMFFANGGADCYIVSVGGYTKTAADGTLSANQVEVQTLIDGIQPLVKEREPTLLVIPELVTLPRAAGEADEAKVTAPVAEMYPKYAEVLNHCGRVMRNRFAILDVWMDRDKYQNDGYDLSRDIELFRNTVNSPVMAWGAAYYPWLQTTAVAASEVDLLNVVNLGAASEVRDYPPELFAADGTIPDKEGFKTTYLNHEISSLTALLEKSLNEEVFAGKVNPTQAGKIKAELKKIGTVTEANAAELSQTLLAVSPAFKALLADLRKALNLLPPSGTMAGIYSMVDNQVGVFQSPANVSVGSVIQPALNISSDQQEDLNLPLDGKAVNAIRSFPGKGVLVWGARTLDGNSQDWRYVSVRRTVIFLEQSIKYAAEPYAFEPNTAPTWSNLKALITNFLTNVWQQGALAGATPEDAFSVDVGLGSTMTPVDMLDGYLRISVKVAVARPAEFIVITVEQKMQSS